MEQASFLICKYRDIIMFTHTHTHRPSRFVGTTIVPLKEAQNAYDLLHEGSTVGVEFTYDR